MVDTAGKQEVVELHERFKAHGENYLPLFLVALDKSKSVGEAMQKADAALAQGDTQLATAHAPAGGITVAGQEFVGGEFIPGDVLASPEEKAKIEQRTGDSKATSTAKPAGQPLVGEGTKEKPYRVGSDLKRAAKLLYQGHHVQLDQPAQVSTLVDHLSRLVRKVEKVRGTAAKIDLCKVSVPGTNLFCQETVGIPRVQMPQMRGLPKPGSYAASKSTNKAGKVDLSQEFIDSLRQQGIGVKQGEVRASYLRASQNEIDGRRILELLSLHDKETLRKRPIFVTRDNYVLDGHHHWAALSVMGAEVGKDYKVPVYVLDMDIGRGVTEANDFARRMGIQPKSAGATLCTEDTSEPAELSTPWNEIDHPRGQPDNAGEFKAKEGQPMASSSPELPETPAPLSRRATVAQAKRILRGVGINGRIHAPGPGVASQQPSTVSVPRRQMEQARAALADSGLNIKVIRDIDDPEPPEETEDWVLQGLREAETILRENLPKDLRAAPRLPASDHLEEQGFPESARKLRVIDEQIRKIEEGQS